MAISVEITSEKLSQQLEESKCPQCNLPAHRGICKCSGCNKRHLGPCLLQCHNCLEHGHKAARCPRDRTTRILGLQHITDRAEVNQIKQLLPSGTVGLFGVDASVPGPMTRKNNRRYEARKKRRKQAIERRRAEDEDPGNKDASEAQEKTASQN